MSPADQKPKTESLYLRTSTSLRDEAERYGEERGLTLSSALAVLVERGLQAVSDETSVVKIERRAQELSKEVAVLHERDNAWRTMFESLQGQLKTLAVGRCPYCRQLVTAFDQFLAHQCPWSTCAQPLHQVLPLPKPEEVPPAVAGLLGALGGFLVGVTASQRT